MQQSSSISIISSSHLPGNSIGKTKTNDLVSTPERCVNAKKKQHVPCCKENSTVIDCIKMGIAEMIGTAILVFLGCLGCVGSLGNLPSHLQICLSFGFAVIIAVTCVAHISGAHINPAVTVGAIVCGNKSLQSALIYIICQLIGGIIGYALLQLITPENFLHGGDPENASNFCVTLLHPQVSIIQGIFSEVIATAVLVFMSCAVADSRNAHNTDSTAIKFGMAVAVLCFGFVPYTGCSMNPARSFGPALLNNQWTQHWIFWLGPLTGALIGSLIYKALFSLKTKKEANVLPENGT